MGERNSIRVVVGVWAIGCLCVGTAAAAELRAGPPPHQDPVLCTWGGTPAATTGTIVLKPGLTFEPSAGPVKLTATGRADCTDGYSGKVTFDGILLAGATCAQQVFEGRVHGLPGVATFYGPGVGGVVHELLYDRDGYVVGSDQPQVLSGVGQGSEFTDCNSEEGVTDAIFSSTIELAR
jgi:hypothetical protein